MANTTFFQMLLDQSDVEARQQLLVKNKASLDDDLAQTLKDLADRFLRADVQRSLQIAATLLLVADHTENQHHRALGLLAEANGYSIGLGQYQKALQKYDAAITIYRRMEDAVSAAKAQVGRVWALASLGRYDEAVAVSEQAAGVLKEAQAWQPLATLTMNLALIHGRQGDDEAALATLNRAYDLFRFLGETGQTFLPWIEQNRSIVLRNLGRIQESITASQEALARMEASGQVVEAARARQNLAITWLLLGRYNDAMILMDEARTTFLNDGRTRDASLLDLFLSGCLLQLRRYDEVIDICQNARQLFSQRNAWQELGRTILNEAVAYAGAERYEEARQSLREARACFARDENPVWEAVADLEQAALLIRLEELEQGEQALQAASRIFKEHRLIIRQIKATLLAAEIALKRQNIGQAETLARQALAMAREQNMPSLRFRGHTLLARCLRLQGHRPQAMTTYKCAIEDLESLRGHMMVEFQADFLEDKTAIYEEAIALALELEQPQQAFALAERSKSRALLSMLAHQIDLSFQARRPEDEPLVQELLAMRAERERLIVRWETREEAHTYENAQKIQLKIRTLEKNIAQRWRQLLVRHADYARDAQLWQVQSDSPQPYLDEKTLLVAYFVARDHIDMFLMDQNTVTARTLAVPLPQIVRLQKLLNLNFHATAHASARQIAPLLKNAQGLLAQLHAYLIAPIQDQLQHYPRLIITPHSTLHYLPFHALFDGHRYLIESHDVSYLPCSSLLRYCTSPHIVAKSTTAFGYSANGLLPHAIQEAQIVADLLSGKVLLEKDATRSRVHDARASVLHFATHGVFRPDEPLFSGIQLADGWLTTLDVFNLKLEASMVTLSACQTGRHSIGGGDELLGMARAFLYAGAASLLLSHWNIDDAVTASFISHFYRQLAGGERKATALRQAQLAILHSHDDDTHQHPFYWAPFFLMGSPDEL